MLESLTKPAMPANRIALVIHAGAGLYPKHLERAKNIQEKLRKFCERGYLFLKNHTALETAVEVTRWLEDWPETNAGVGAMLQSDGVARLSASLMDGYEKRFSGVINIEKIKNPILVASLLQTERDRILASDGALCFAKEKGFKRFDLCTKESIKRWHALRKKNHYGTVGVCALDSKGRLAAATSTGGKGMERVGRVSDSALPAGNFANDYAAVSATGIGEEIVEEALASILVTRATDLKNLEKSFKETFKEAKKRKRKLAAIGLDRNGKIFWAHTAEILYYAFQNNSGLGGFRLQ